ncbi:TMhelix containing protein [Vibrio phage 1.052.A._10N.286.46.C3]|nr:TMhelix containing protein [Vibrio phage 1.052.A._10N.286.46.C3]
MSKFVMFLIFVMGAFFSLVGVSAWLNHDQVTAFLWIGIYFDCAFVYYLVKNRNSKTKLLNSVSKS